jgi:multiple sugar transport system substrate-binding protein
MTRTPPQPPARGRRTPLSRRRFLGTSFAAAGGLSFGLVPAGPTLNPFAAAQAMAADAKPFAGKTIRYQQRDSSAENFVRHVFAPRFEEETGCTVVLEDIPQAELFAKAQIMAAAGQIGDLVFGFDTPWLASWAARGMLRPLDDLIAADGYDLGQFYPSAVEAFTIDGQVYGLPTAGHPSIVNLFYNKKMMRDAGVTPPDAAHPDEAWTWDDVLEAAKALTQDTNGDGQTDVWGFHPARFHGMWAFTHVRQFGGDLLSADGRQATVGSPEGQAAYRYLYDLIYTHKVTAPPDAISPGTTTGRFAGEYFGSGRVAMFTDATILITTMGSFVPEGFEWGVFPIPAGPGGSRGASTFLNTTSVTSQSREPEAAWAFLKLICSHEAGSEKLLMNSGSPGVRPDVFQDPRVTEAFPWFEVGHKVMEEARPLPRPENFRTAELNEATLQTEAAIWLDRISPEEGALQMQREFERILQEPA